LKNIFLICFVFLFSLFAKDENKIVVAGPFATVSHPIMHMIETDALKDLGKSIEFRLWNNWMRYGCKRSSNNYFIFILCKK
jgi:NitT/TauT family transport system substrate-binding protein